MPPALPVLPVQPKVQDCASPVWAVSNFRIGLGSRGGKKCLFAWIVPKCGPMCRRLQMVWGVLHWVSPTGESTNKEGRAGGSELLRLSCI